MSEPTRTVLTHAEIRALAKIAAMVHDHDLLEVDATSSLVVDLCRKCSEAIARGEVLAIATPEMNLLTALSNGSSKAVGHAAACGHFVTDRQDLHWSDDLEDEVCPDCCEKCK